MRITIFKSIYSPLIFWLLIPLSLFAEKPLPEVPDAPKSEIKSIGIVRLSMLKALEGSSNFSFSLSAFRPFELGGGFFNERARKVNGFYVNTGIFIPWIGDRYTIGRATTRELFMVAGYMHEKPIKGITSSSANSNTRIQSLTYEIGLENIEWMSPSFGFDLRLSLGLQYIINSPTLWDTVNLAPIIEIAFGIAF